MTFLLHLGFVCGRVVAEGLEVGALVATVGTAVVLAVHMKSQDNGEKQAQVEPHPSHGKRILLFRAAAAGMNLECARNSRHCAGGPFIAFSQLLLQEL